MSISTVAVTGGNGRVGGAIIRELNNHGYRTVNLNRGKAKNRVVDDADDGANRYLQTQMLDPGNVYGSVAESEADAIVHMASIPNPLTNVGYETYESNVLSTYYVLEAAAKLELEAAVVPSSINVMGGPFQQDPMEVKYLPVDENHPVTPRDPYAISKHSIEVTADGFGRRSGPPFRIASLRYPWVATETELEETFASEDRSLPAVTTDDATFGRDDLFSYIHIDDAATIARAAIEGDFRRHERFWAVANDTTASATTTSLIESCYPNARLEQSFSERDSIVSTTKARRMLGWQPTHTWT